MDWLRRVPGVVWIFIAVLAVIAAVAWLGYPYWSETP
jgi:hypothetical protein